MFLALALEVTGVFTTMRTSDGDLTIKWAPQAMVAIRELHQAEAVDLRWATSWVDSPGDLRDLEAMLGTPQPSCRQPWTSSPRVGA